MTFDINIDKLSDMALVSIHELVVESVDQLDAGLAQFMLVVTNELLNRDLLEADEDEGELELTPAGKLRLQDILEELELTQS